MTGDNTALNFEQSYSQDAKEGIVMEKMNEDFLQSVTDVLKKRGKMQKQLLIYQWFMHILKQVD